MWSTLMVRLAGGQPLPDAIISPEVLTTSGVGSKLSYAALLQPQTTKRIPFPLKNIMYLQWGTKTSLGGGGGNTDDCERTSEICDSWEIFISLARYSWS